MTQIITETRDPATGMPRQTVTYVPDPVSPSQQSDVRNQLGVSAGELINISHAGGGILSTIGSTYEVKPSQQFIQEEAKKEIEKTAGESITKIEDIRSPSGSLTSQYFRGESGKLYLYDYSKSNLTTYGGAERIQVQTASGYPITLSAGVTQKVGGAEGLKLLMMQQDIKHLGESYGEYAGAYAKAVGEIATGIIISNIQTAIISGISGAVWISDVPKLTIGLSTVYLGYSTYGLTKESIEGTLTPLKTALYLTSIGLSAAGIYSGFLQMKPTEIKKLEFGALSKEDITIKGNVKNMEGYVTGKSQVTPYENVLTREEISKMFEQGKTIRETQNVIIKDWEGYKGYFFKNPTGFPENMDDLINIAGKQITYVGKFSGMNVVVGEKIGFPVSFTPPKEGGFKITIASPPDNFVGTPLSKTFPIEISGTQTVVSITQTINNPPSPSIPALNIIPIDISIEKSISTVIFKTQEKQTTGIRTITQLSLEQQFNELANIKNPILKDYTTNIFKTTPVEIQTPRFSTDQKSNFKTTQIPLVKLETVNINREIEQININRVTQLIPTEFIFNIRETGAAKVSKIIVKSEFGKPKIFKVSSRILPTASLESLERSFAKYGKGSLARGSNIEKIFRNLARSSGLAAEFPAAEFIRGGKRK